MYKRFLLSPALSKGKHVFEIVWPQHHRGTHASVGVASDDCPLYCKPKDSLPGVNKVSWGYDIARKLIVHNAERVANMTTMGMVPDKYVCFWETYIDIYNKLW